MNTALAVRPETIRAQVACDPERRELLRTATGELLTAVQTFLEEYVALPDRDITGPVIALWCLHTWVLQACDATPYLMVLSQEAGSGKTRLMETLSYVIRKPWHTANTTPTALFRRMSEEKPTLLLDEIDAVFRGGSCYEALRQVLDAGNRRGSTVTRCDGKWGTVEYQTFGAKILAGIDTGFIPHTIMDRSIVIRMVKTKAATARLRPRIAAQQAAPLAQTLQAWASVVVDELAKETPDLPEFLDDRAADAYEPLLAIADFAGEEWGGKTRSAAQALSPASAPLIEVGVAQALDPGLGSLLPAMQGVMAG